MRNSNKEVIPEEPTLEAEVTEVPVKTIQETITSAGEEVSQVNTEARLEGALKAVLDSIAATGEEAIVAPWVDPVRERQLQILRNWNKHREDVELPEEELPWLWEGGFLRVEEESISLVDKDEFEKTLTIKFSPVIKALGGDDQGFGAALHRVLNPKKPTRKN